MWIKQLPDISIVNKGARSGIPEHLNPYEEVKYSQIFVVETCKPSIF